MDFVIELLCDILFDAGIKASTSFKLPKPLRIVCCILTSLAFLAIITVLTLVVVICLQDMPLISILLGALDIMAIFMLLSIIARAFCSGKRKK